MNIMMDKINPILITIISIVVIANLSSSTPVGISDDLAVIRLCNISSPVSLETVNSVLMHRDMENPGARTEAFECFLFCLYIEYGWMDRYGGFEFHAIRPALINADIPEYRIGTLLYSCTSTESESPCRRAFLFTECFWSHTKYILILEVRKFVNDK